MLGLNGDQVLDVQFRIDEQHVRHMHLLAARSTASAAGVWSALSRKALRHASSCPSEGPPVRAHPISGYLSLARVMILLNSRSHSTELATAAQYSQSLRLKFVVENASCSNGM